MTLNGLNGHFTLNFHYYEQPFESCYLLVYCRVCLYTHMTSGDVRKLCIFRRRYVVGTLTNKTNIRI